MIHKISYEISSILSLIFISQITTVIYFLRITSREKQTYDIKYLMNILFLISHLKLVKQLIIKIVR